MFVLVRTFCDKKTICVHLNNKVKKLLKAVLYWLYWIILAIKEANNYKMLQLAFSLFTASIMRLRSVETVLSYCTWFYNISSRWWGINSGEGPIKLLTEMLTQNTGSKWWEHIYETVNVGIMCRHSQNQFSLLPLMCSQFRLTWGNLFPFLIFIFIKLRS